MCFNTIVLLFFNPLTLMCFNSIMLLFFNPLTFIFFNLSKSTLFLCLISTLSSDNISTLFLFSLVRIFRHQSKYYSAKPQGKLISSCYLRLSLAVTLKTDIIKARGVKSQFCFINFWSVWKYIINNFFNKIFWCIKFNQNCLAQN